MNAVLTRPFAAPGSSTDTGWPTAHVHQPFEALTPEQARAAYAASWNVTQSPATEVASVRDTTIPGKGGELALRIYRGIGTQPDEMLSCMVFLHGGGWVIGNLDSHDSLCRRLANAARICIVAVNYRLAPEHRFPAAVDDSVTALQWVCDNVDGLKIARGRVGVCGYSAGGNLAATLALMGHDGTAPRSIFQALIYPVVDLGANSDLYRRVTTGVPLTAGTMAYFIDHYAPNPTDPHRLACLAAKGYQSGRYAASAGGDRRPRPLVRRRAGLCSAAGRRGRALAHDIVAPE